MIMVLQSSPAVELASAPRTALDYPNIRKVAVTADQAADLPPQTLAMALFIIETIRCFERWLLDNAGLVHGPLHSSIGQEAVAAGMGLALLPTDKLTSTHRAHHDVLAKLIVFAAPAAFDPLVDDAVPEPVIDAVRRTLAEVLGLAQGLCGGRGGSMHLADEAAGIMTSAIVAGGLPVAAGEALASRLRGSGEVAVAVFGDGSSAIGAFHEAASLARAWNLPVIFLLENNQYSVATSLRESAGFEELAIRAAGYDMPALIVDGMDPVAVFAAMTKAREHAAASGPVLVEALTYRYFHQNGPLPGSAFRYRTREEERHWANLDPAVVFPRRLIELNLVSEIGVERIQALAARLVEDCVAALTIEGPDGPMVPADLYPTLESIPHGLLGPGVRDVAPALLDPVPAPDASEMLYAAAISGVIARWLERDPDAFVLGEEVGHLGGGVAGLTKDALAAAPERVLSTPICENGFTGAALGAALMGMHPIVEFMYPDFTLEAADELFNHIAKARYMYGGHHEVPIIVRTQISRGRGYGPQHSCDPASLFSLFPGWRIASPSTAADYIGLFNGAMLSRDPVLVIDDHRLAKAASPIPPAGLDFVIPPGSARVIRAGHDVTVVAWGHALHRVVALTDELRGQGVDLEIIDPRWLDRTSFDRATVLDSVRRTGALVIVEDATHSHSMGATILDYLQPDLFSLLNSAPVRVTGMDVPSPVSRPLETQVHLRDEQILESIVRAARARAGGERE